MMEFLAKTPVSYSRVDVAIRLIKITGPGSFLAKRDIKNAFRTVPIKPSDYALLGIFWEGKYFFYLCMPMGCSSSCKTLEVFSTSIEWTA